jgi:hypothetical protein
MVAKKLNEGLFFSLSLSFSSHFILCIKNKKINNEAYSIKISIYDLCFFLLMYLSILNKILAGPHPYGTYLIFFRNSKNHILKPNLNPHT